MGYQTQHHTAGVIKVRLQVMAEVMAKSKAFKAERQAQNDEDADERDQLDSTFNTLMQVRLLQIFASQHLGWARHA